jgi:phosphatidylinositol glycan class C protein
VLLLWSAYLALRSGELHPASLLGGLAAALLALHCRAALLPGPTTVLLFSAIGFALSPVLCRLTESISTDTIHTMAAAGLLLHLLTRDYGLQAPIVSSATSLNAAVFSAVCLASRFDHHLAAFSLLSLAVFLFLVLPLGPALLPHPLLSSGLHGCLALLALHRAAPGSALLALGLLLALQLLCPLLFYRLQACKHTIHGPWDEAVLQAGRNKPSKLSQT